MKLLGSFLAAFAGYVVLSNVGVGLPAWSILPAAFGFTVLFSNLNNSQPGTSGSAWAQKWDAAAHELELRSHTRSAKGKFSTMRGEIDGHRVSVASIRNGDPEIEVRFESGLRSLDIDPRRKPERPTDTSTGDRAFDEAFRVRSRDDKDLLTWLTPARREILVVLNDALDLREVEEDELEVKLGTDEWSASELIQAVQLCVLVAQTLDRSYRSVQSPQDAIRPSDSPQDAPLSDYLRSDDPQAETPKDVTGPESFD